MIISNNQTNLTQLSEFSDQLSNRDSILFIKKSAFFVRFLLKFMKKYVAINFSCQKTIGCPLIVFTDTGDCQNFPDIEQSSRQRSQLTTAIGS